MTRICSVPAKNGDITQNRIYFDMLKIIILDIKLFNHIFDIYNGGMGIFAEFEENSDKVKRPDIWKKKASGENDDDDENVKVTD